MLTRRAWADGAIAGLFLVGTAFIIPRVIGETVIEQAGGAPVLVESPWNCDELLREQLIRDRNAFTVARLNATIRSVQSQHLEACAVDIWNPLVVDARSGAGCAYAIEVGGQRYPSGLQDPDPTPSYAAISCAQELWSRPGQQYHSALGWHSSSNGQREVLDVRVRSRSLVRPVLGLASSLAALGAEDSMAV